MSKLVESFEEFLIEKSVRLSVCLSVCLSGWDALITDLVIKRKSIIILILHIS